MADVRMGRDERVRRALTAKRKRARNRFITALIATIERFQGWRTGPSGVDGLGSRTTAKNVLTNNGAD
jgi:hypothetical protein